MGIRGSDSKQHTRERGGRERRERGVRGGLVGVGGGGGGGGGVIFFFFVNRREGCSVSDAAL